MLPSPEQSSKSDVESGSDDESSSDESNTSKKILKQRVESFNEMLRAYERKKKE